MVLEPCEQDERRPFLGSRADPMQCTACGRRVFVETDPSSPLFDRTCIFEADVSPALDGRGKDHYQSFTTPSGETVRRLIDDRKRDPRFDGRHHFGCMCSNTLEIEHLLRQRRALAARKAAVQASHAAAAVAAAKEAAAAFPVQPAGVEAARAAAAAAEAAAAAKAAESVPQDSAAGNEYTVAAILDVKAVAGGTRYLIKWEGYDDEADNTWEPEANLDCCSELLAEFKGTSCYADFAATRSSAPADAAGAPEGEHSGGHVCNVCFKQLKRGMPGGLMRLHKVNGVAGVDCKLGAELPALTVAAAAKLDRKDPEKILQQRVQQSGRAGTITQFSKQTGYRVTFDDTGSGAPHEDFGIVAIRKLLAAATDT